MDKKDIILHNKLNELKKSKFRSSFHLRKYMIKYINEKGIKTINAHAYDFVKEKIAPSNPLNDGKQTPTKNHPVFIAMHACACCCRGCLYKWHHIEKNRDLTNNEINYIVSLIMLWIIEDMKLNIDNNN